MEVIVQTCPERREVIGPTLESLKASDVGDNYVLMEHPAGMPRCVFYGTVLARMAKAATEYVFRLEDDVLVNRYLLHNTRTWPALKHPLFGAGWLYRSKMARMNRTQLHIEKHSGLAYRLVADTHGSLCVVMPTWLAREAAEAWKVHVDAERCALRGCAAEERACVLRSAEKQKFGQDTFLSQMAHRNKKRVFYHDPAIAENRMIKSIRGTTYRPKGAALVPHLSAGEEFQLDWRR